MPCLTNMRRELFENIVGKGENAGNQQFILFPQNVFHPIKEELHHMSHFKIVVCKCFQIGQG